MKEYQICAVLPLKAIVIWRICLSGLLAVNMDAKLHLPLIKKPLIPNYSI
jgi:hypothetical protein